MRTGELRQHDWDRFSSARAQVKDKPLYIDDTPRAHAERPPHAGAPRGPEAGGLRMIMVDYLQLMRSSAKQENRTNEISDISRSLKAIAKR